MAETLSNEDIQKVIESVESGSDIDTSEIAAKYKAEEADVPEVRGRLRMASILTHLDLNGPFAVDLMKREELTDGTVYYTSSGPVPR